MTGDLCDNNNKKYKMINECDPVINNKNVKHLSYRSFKVVYSKYRVFIYRIKTEVIRLKIRLEVKIRLELTRDV